MSFFENFKKYIFIIIAWILIPSSAWGVSSLTCLGATVAEYLIPGLGYGILGQYDKMLVLGGSRWLALRKYVTYMDTGDYEESYEKIYKKSNLSDDKLQHDFFYSKETYFANAYLSIYSDLTFVTFYDLYENDCDYNSETYGLMLSPFKIWEYADELTFWVPTLWVSSVPMDSDSITYHVDDDLSRNEMINTSFLQYQLVGVGEEMLFRGVIQQSLFKLLSGGGVSKNLSRWGSILTASAVFGAAHAGRGFSATPGIAFAAGVYLGWVYHPAEGDFDLTQPIAIHSWWDTILENRRLRGSKFVERKPGENAENYSFSSYRTYPLFGFNFIF